MDVSRRDFLRLSVAAGSGTALSGLVGSGVNLGPAVARAQELRIKNAKVTPSVCPYCSVGCGTLIHTIDGKIVNIEGDPRSPHNEGTLCPKGAAIFQLHVNPNRPTQVLHRAAGRCRLGGVGSRARDEPDRRADQEDARRNLYRKAAQRQARQYDARHLRLRRRHPRGRVQPHLPESSCAVSASSPSRIRRGYDTALASPVWGPDSAAAQPPSTRGAWPTPTASSSWAPIWRKTIPVAFRWPMKAKVEHGAKIIHVDPRFTRTSAVADIYAPVRAGSDIAFLGGVIKYVLDSERWNNDPFFKTFVVNYTNAATIINDDFKDTEELNGVFSGLLQSKGGVNEWPFNGFTNQYDGASWQYARTKVGAQGEAAAATARSGETIVSTGATGTERRAADAGQAAAKVTARARRSTPLVASLVKPPPQRDETLQNPRCVFQIVKKHFARYTPEMVEKTHRLPQGNVSQSRRDHSGQFGRGPDDFIRLCRCLDAAHLRRPNHRRLRAAAASARKYRPARRGRHGAARPRLDPGLDGCSDALPLDPGLYGGADGAQEARHPAGLPRG